MSRFAFAAVLVAQLAVAIKSTTPSTADYCTATPSADVVLRRADLSEVTPPLPCPGYYAVQEGRCCKVVDGVGDDCADDPSRVLWEMPLAPCVTANPSWNGCPGNMQGSTCCLGAGVGLGFSTLPTGTGLARTVSCEDGVAFVVTTTNGQTITSTPSPTTTSQTTTAKSSSSATSSSSGNAAAATPVRALAGAAIVGAAGALIAAW